MDLHVKDSKILAGSLATSKKNSTPQPSRAYSKYAEMTLYAEATQCSPYINGLGEKSRLLTISGIAEVLNTR